MSRLLANLLKCLRLGPRPSAVDSRSAEDQVNAYLDAPTSRRTNDDFIDAMLRDPSVLDDLADQRPWMDDLAHRPVRSPDHSDDVLRRLGLAAQGSRGSHHYARMRSRRPLLCAVCVAAFAFGMWARSQAYLVDDASNSNGIDQQVADVIRNVPTDLQPLGKVQTMLIRIGEDFSTSLAPRPGVSATTSMHAEPMTAGEVGPIKPHVAQTGAWFLAGPVAVMSSYADRPQSNSTPHKVLQPDNAARQPSAPAPRRANDGTPSPADPPSTPATGDDGPEPRPVDDADLLDALSNLGCRMEM